MEVWTAAGGQDVREIEGHWWMILTPEAGTVKTRAAGVVPLYPHLPKWASSDGHKAGVPVLSFTRQTISQGGARSL